MRRWRFIRRRAVIALIGILALCFAGYALLFVVPSVQRSQSLGIQFSTAHARWLGLDWQKTYIALLDDLGVRSFRLGAYWNDLSIPGTALYNFDDLDWMLAEAQRRGATVILAVGRRLPRWPECHVPDWVRALPEQGQREALLEYERAVVERYRDHPALRVWQVENEPLLSLFGECPPPDRALLEREVALVRSLDRQHPILITDSGELSMWMRTSAIGDLLGTTMYRVVWNPIVGYWSYDHIVPPAFYRLKAWLAGVPAERMIVSELQAEPWVPRGDILSVSLAEQRQSMDAERLRRNVTFARATGFSEAYLWGAEYWYWLKEKQGDSSLWEAARDVFQAE
ncbi:MAG: beta-galactosidase [Candidatus Uhrbacteria bacterium]